MTTETPTPAVPKTIRVQFLTPVEGQPSSKWPVTRVEDMPYDDYLGMGAEALANTRPVRTPRGNETKP